MARQPARQQWVAAGAWRHVWHGLPLLAGLALLVFWPALDAFLVRDDFAQVAYARLVGSPWVLFFQDHFIPAGAFFRPLGFAALWLTTAMAGMHIAVHYATALLLHLMVTLALLAVLRRVLSGHALAALLALLFAVHPLAIGTSLWLADRFDLLAALFMLLALRAAWDFRIRPTCWRLGATLACALLAMLSKETGLVIVVPVSMLWLGMAGRAIRLQVRVSAMLALWLMPVLYLVWRALVLGGLGGGDDITAQSALQLLFTGAGNWLAHLPGYLFFWPRLDTLTKLVTVLALLALVATWLMTRRSAPLRGGRLSWLLAGLAMLVLPAAVQAPVAAISAMALDADMSAIDAAMQARLYYISLCGLMILLAAALDPLPRGRVAATHFAALTLLVMSAAPTAHRLACDYARQSQQIRPLADAAVKAVAKLDIPESACQIYLLGTQPPPEWGLHASMDSIVKARVPDLSRIDHCLIQTEAAPYFHLLRRGALDRVSVAPMQRIPGGVAGLPLFAVGDMEVAALNLHAKTDARQIPEAHFLAWQGGRFADVTQAVRSGERKVQFHCIRGPQQCPDRALPTQR